MYCTVLGAKRPEKGGQPPISGYLVVSPPLTVFCRQLFLRQATVFCVAAFAARPAEARSLLDLKKKDLDLKDLLVKKEVVEVPSPPPPSSPPPPAKKGELLPRY